MKIDIADSTTGHATNGPPPEAPIEEGPRPPTPSGNANINEPTSPAPRCPSPVTSTIDDSTPNVTPASTTRASSPAHDNASPDENMQWTHSWNDGQSSGTTTYSGANHGGINVSQFNTPGGSRTMDFINTFTFPGSSRHVHNTNAGSGSSPSDSSSSTTYQNQKLDSVSLPNGAVIKNCRVNSCSGSNFTMTDCRINSCSISDSLVHECRVDSSSMIRCRANDSRFDSCSIVGGRRSNCRYDSCSVVG